MSYAYFWIYSEGLVVAVEWVNLRNGQLAVKMSFVGFMDNRVFVNKIQKISVKVD